MIKRFFIVSLSLSALCFSFNACEDSAAKSEEAARFEDLLEQAGLKNKDSVDYVIWNGSSCAGCRSFTARLFAQYGDSVKPVVFIVPYGYSNETRSIDNDYLFIDSTGIFDEFYFGIDNVGIIRVGKEGVYRLKNYNANAMDTLEKDFRKR